MRWLCSSVLTAHSRWIRARSPTVSAVHRSGSSPGSGGCSCQMLKTCLDDAALFELLREAAEEFGESGSSSMHLPRFPSGHDDGIDEVRRRDPGDCDWIFSQTVSLASTGCSRFQGRCTQNGRVTGGGTAKECSTQFGKVCSSALPSMILCQT